MFISADKCKSRTDQVRQEEGFEVKYGVSLKIIKQGIFRIVVVKAITSVV